MTQDKEQNYILDPIKRGAKKSAKDTLPPFPIALDVFQTYLEQLDIQFLSLYNRVVPTLQALQESETDPERRSQLLDIELDIQESLIQIEQGIDMVSLNEGKIELENSSFALVDFLESWTQRWQNQQKKSHTSKPIQIEISRQLPANFYGDKSRLCMVLDQLTRFSQKLDDFTSLMIQVDATLSTDDTKPSYVEISFLIEGTSYEHLQSHLDKSETQISITQHIAHLLGGELDINSTGKLSLKLPIKAEQQDPVYLSGGEGSKTPIPNPSQYSQDKAMPIRGQSKWRPLTTQAGQPPLILLAEDNKTNQMVLTEYLGRFGCLLDIANDGAEAIKLARQKPYNAILMDIGMPNLNGIEATKTIRQFDTVCQKAPIIALTAYAMAEDKEECKQAGMTDFISKPIDSMQLYKAIKKALEAPLSEIPQTPAENADIPITTFDLLDPNLDNEAPKLELMPELTDGLVDISVYNRLIDGLPPELQNKLRDSFITDLTAASADIEQALNSKDQELCERRSHVIKSITGTFGATRLHHFSHALNDSCRANSWDLVWEKLPIFLEQNRLTLDKFVKMTSSHNEKDA